MAPSSPPPQPLTDNLRIEVMAADITTLLVDGLVNAANKKLLGGGGVDGAIHRAAGPDLLEACRSLPEVSPGVRCPTGQARITPGYKLRAAHVIHTVGPIWAGGGRDEAGFLESCYTQSLRLAVKHNLKSLAFPCISTGIYGYPKEEAAQIALTAVRKWLATHAIPQRVIFCCFNPDDAECYRALMTNRNCPESKK